MIKECAARIGTRRCQHDPVPGKMFCSLHLHASNRIHLPVITINPDVRDTKAFEDYRRGYR